MFAMHIDCNVCWCGGAEHQLTRRNGTNSTNGIAPDREGTGSRLADVQPNYFYGISQHVNRWTELIKHGSTWKIYVCCKCRVVRLKT